MKRSGSIILTTIFLAAIASANAKAQEVRNGGERKAEDNAPIPQEDTSGRVHGQSHSYGHVRKSHGIFSIFHHHHYQSQQPSTVQTHTPRTNGFGNTLRTSSATAHS